MKHILTAQRQLHTLPAGKLAFLEADFHAFSTRSDAASLSYVRPQFVVANHFEQPWPGAWSPDARLVGEYGEHRELWLGESTCSRNQLLLTSVVLGQHFIWQRLSLFYSDRFTLRQTAQPSPLFQFAVSRGPHVVVQCISVHIMFLLAIFWRSHLANMLFIARRSFFNYASRQQVTSDSC
jgi:hypothetical protein